MDLRIATAGLQERLVGTEARVGRWAGRGYLKQHLPRAWTVDTMVWPSCGSDDPAAIHIAVTVLLAPGERWGLRVGDTFYDNTPSLPTGEVDPTWDLLGWDVADGSQLSAVTNCGWDEREEPTVGDHGLFTSVAEALAWRDYADREIPGHDPFYVYGVYVTASGAPRR